jgi:plastocyanin
MRRVIAVVLTVSAGLIWVLPARAGVGTVIAIDDFEFIPSTRTVPTVTGSFSLQFDNGGSFQHTATSDDGMFDTGQIASGESGVETIYGAGTYNYHCQNHVQMTGTVRMRPTASDTRVTVGASIDVRVGADFLKGVVWDVQRRRAGGEWQNVRVDTFDATPTFTMNRVGTFEFRTRTDFFKGENHSKWSPVRKVVVEAPAA